ncbi:MAG: hypothetical protein JWR32_2633 [Mycobacterium sp.]|jgi:hypothetical protein|nr:hypothetical protein [Mycobacterium sp.]
MPTRCACCFFFGNQRLRGPPKRQIVVAGTRLNKRQEEIRTRHGFVPLIPLGTHRAVHPIEHRPACGSPRRTPSCRRKALNLMYTMFGVGPGPNTSH